MNKRHSHSPFFSSSYYDNNDGDSNNYEFVRGKYNLNNNDNDDKSWSFDAKDNESWNFDPFVKKPPPPPPKPQTHTSSSCPYSNDPKYPCFYFSLLDWCKCNSYTFTGNTNWAIGNSIPCDDCKKIEGKSKYSFSSNVPPTASSNPPTTLANPPTASANQPPTNSDNKNDNIKNDNNDSKNTKNECGPFN
jgi:hypothetical protein